MPVDATRRIAVVSSSRADYSHLVWPLHALCDHAGLEPLLVVFGAHLAPEFGHTADQATEDGFPIAARVESHVASDTRVGMAKSLGLATLGLADAFERLAPDLVLIIADRYEMLAAANVATTLRLPIAHIEGGEISRGAIDDAIRNALTKLAHLHLTPHQTAANRVAALGEEPWRIHVTGAPSLDHLHHAAIPGAEEIRDALGLGTDRIAVVAFHAVTLDRDSAAEAVALFAALEALEETIVFCFPNADAGSGRIRRLAEQFVADRPNAHLFVNLSPPHYFGLLGAASLMLGNSSSGIMESPSFALPCVNIGRRQEGRLMAANIITTRAETHAILAAVAEARSWRFDLALDGLENPYGDGHAGARIAGILAAAPDADTLLDKR